MSDNPQHDPTGDNIDFAVQLTTAWLSNPNTRASEDEVLTFLQGMHDAVSQLSDVGETVEPDEVVIEHIPAVSARKSLASKDHILSMIDGKPYRTLRRHLATHGLTPEQYRERYRLKPDYPMVAADYSEARRAMAKKIGLGRKPSLQPKGAGKGSDPKSERKSAAAEG